MNNIFKKISFGISLEISLEEYQQIIKRYSPFLSSVYFSLPYGDEFHTRERVIKEYRKENAERKLIEILNLFKKNGIKLEAVINQYHIEPKKIEYALNKLDNIIQIDSICCLDEYFDIIQRHYKGTMYIISSFNNQPIYSKNIQQQLIKLKDYNMLVLSREFMRDENLLKIIKDNGFDIKLLINNGCAFNCLTCRAGGKKCKEIFNNNLKKYSPEELYAIQSLFPWELKKLMDKVKDNDLITEIKISNRPCSYEYLNNCLESYIYGIDERKYINITNKNYHLWGRQANLIPFYNQFNLDRINKIKRSLIKKIRDK